jgi:hypothetical protein
MKETAKTKAPAKKDDTDLLNGPQNGAGAKSQEEIDRMFG